MHITFGNRHIQMLTNDLYSKALWQECYRRGAYKIGEDFFVCELSHQEKLDLLRVKYLKVYFRKVHTV